jgi:signal transduction histidine kinase
LPRLHEFIREHTEEILVEWEAFARSLPVTESMDIAGLRDHAKAMLLVIARDLETPQTAGEQTDKAEGKSDAADTGPSETAAQEHGAARAGSGFTVAEMLSELRALRASVIRLWTTREPTFAVTHLEDMVRFNEAIDQAIAESATQYGEEIGNTKERFLAILGHDLRNPLGAIIMSASFLLEEGELVDQNRELVSRIGQSARRMNQMVSDLLDFTRSELGGSAIPIARAPMDIGKMAQDVGAEVGTRYPAHVVKVETDGALDGSWDCARLTQALTNLVTNAVQHGAERSPIVVVARGTADEVAIAVRNDGAVIPKEDLGRIFKAGEQVKPDAVESDEHMGLGLFIVERIVAAHGGTVDVESTEAHGTIFTMHLPRIA